MKVLLGLPTSKSKTQNKKLRGHPSEQERGVGAPKARRARPHRCPQPITCCQIVTHLKNLSSKRRPIPDWTWWIHSVRPCWSKCKTCRARSLTAHRFWMLPLKTHETGESSPGTLTDAVAKLILFPLWWWPIWPKSKSLKLARPRWKARDACWTRGSSRKGAAVELYSRSLAQASQRPKIKKTPQWWQTTFISALQPARREPLETEFHTCVRTRARILTYLLAYFLSFFVSFLRTYLLTYLLTPGLTYLLITVPYLTLPYFSLFYFLLTYSLTFLRTYLFTYLLTYDWLTDWLNTYWLTYLLTYLLTHLPSYLLAYFLAYLFTYLLTYLTN